MDQATESRAREKLSLGRAYVLSRADYYSSVLLEMTVEIVDADVTMGVTRGLVLYVSGNWLLSDPELKGDDVVGACLVHECEHILRGLDRLEALPHKELANIAADEAINCNLKEEGWKLPSWVVYPSTMEHPDNKTLEQYYEMLIHDKDSSSQTVQQLMDGAVQAASKTQTTWKPQIGAGSCGSIGGLAADKNLEDALDAEHGKSATEVECVRRQALDAIEKASTRGNIPGRFKELIKYRNKKPDVNWRSALKHILQRAIQKVSGASDYSISNPSIGAQLTGYIGAGLIDRQLNVVIVEDTSGSMGEPQLVNARNEAYHLMRKIGINEATHIQVDTDIQSVRTIRMRDLPKLAYHGRGGTDFRAVFRYVETKLPRTNLLVYFTDGDGEAPEHAPTRFSTVWCIVRTPYARRPANWGHLVVCDKSQLLR